MDDGRTIATGKTRSGWRIVPFALGGLFAWVFLSGLGGVWSVVLGPIGGGTMSALLFAAVVTMVLRLAYGHDFGGVLRITGLVTAAGLALLMLAGGMVILISGGGGGSGNGGGLGLFGVLLTVGLYLGSGVMIAGVIAGLTWISLRPADQANR